MAFGGGDQEPVLLFFRSWLVAVFPWGNVMFGNGCGGMPPAGRFPLVNDLDSEFVTHLFALAFALLGCFSSEYPWAFYSGDDGHYR